MVRSKLGQGNDAAAADADEDEDEAFVTATASVAGGRRPSRATLRTDGAGSDAASTHAYLADKSVKG